MKRWLFFVLCSLLAGCVNVPGTKAIVSPFAVIGFHRFAPVETAEAESETALIAEGSH